jgi:hypothetical protein
MPPTRSLVVRFVTGLFSNWRAICFLLASVAVPIVQGAMSWRSGTEVTVSLWWVPVVGFAVASFFSWRDLALQVDQQLELLLPSDSDAPGFYQSSGSWEQVQSGWDPETDEPIYQPDDSWEIYRLLVRNLSVSKTVRNVRLQLKGVVPDVWGPAGKISSFPLPLHPEHLSHDTYLFDLAPGEEHFVDVIHFSGGPIVKICAVSVSSVGLYADKRPTLELQAVGDDVPASPSRFLQFWIHAGRLRTQDATPADATGPNTKTLNLLG